MEILKLDGYIVDLEPKQVAQTLQINDLAEVQNRQANYTNRFTLPPTPNNIKLMDYLGISGNQSLKPYQRIPAKLIVDGIELISNGYAQINESGQGYDVVVYDGNISLYEALKGRRLNQLNFNDLNHFLTESAYLDSFTNTTGYIYGLGDFGVKRPFSLIRIDYQAPSVYLHTLWDKVFTDLGFTYEGDIFESDDFKSEVVGPVNGYPIQADALETEDLVVMTSNPVNRNEFETEYKSYVDDYSFNYATPYSDKVENNDNQSITTLFNGRIRLDISYRLNITYGGVYIRIYRNDEVVKTLYSTTGSDPVADAVFFPVEIGDRISAKVFSFTTIQGPESPEEPEGNYYELAFTSNIDFDVKEQIGGEFIDFSVIMPETSQIDFVKDVMQRYGLMYTQDRNSNHFKFIRFEKLLNDRANAEDWSNKLVSLGKEQYSFGEYARSNKMVYQYEKDVLNLDFDGALVVNNDLLDAEKTLFTSIYKIRQVSLQRLSTPVYLIPIWEEVEDDDLLTIQPAKSELSLFRIEKKNMSITYQLYEQGTVENYSGDIPFLSLNNIQFQYYINNYYKAFGRLLERPKKRTNDTFNLSVIDVYNIDFFRLKYLKQLGQYYYLNKVNNFQNGKNTRVELIQVVGKSENSPPTVLGNYTRYISHGATFSPSLSYFTTLTTPQYFDPEFDAPERVLITGGFEANVKVMLDGVEQTEAFEFDANDFDLSFEDLENDTNAHGYIFPFKIKSFNAEAFSEVTGELRLNVRAKVFVDPVADAGPDATYTYDELDDSINPDTKAIYLDGSNSSDNESIESYAWTIISQPIDSQATFVIDANQSAVVEILDDGDQYGQYVFELTVTDNDGLTDSDQVTITINPSI